MRPCLKSGDPKGKPRRLGAIPPAITGAVPNAPARSRSRWFHNLVWAQLRAATIVLWRHAVFDHVVLGIGQRAAGPARHNGGHRPQVRRAVGQAWPPLTSPPTACTARRFANSLTPMFPCLAPCHSLYPRMLNPAESTVLAPCAVSWPAIRSIILRNTAEPSATYAGGACCTAGQARTASCSRAPEAPGQFPIGWAPSDFARATSTAGTRPPGLPLGMPGSSRALSAIFAIHPT